MPTTAQIKNSIADLYQKQLGHAPDAASLQRYTEQVLGGKSLSDINAELNTSAEGKSYDDAVVKALYKSLGREGFGTTANTIDQEGYDYWMNELQSGRVTPEQIRETFNRAAILPQNEAGYSAARAAGATNLVDQILEEQLGKDITAIAPSDRERIANYTRDLLSQGKTVDQITQELNRSTEGVNFDTQAITAIYRQEFGRDADQEGYQYWVSRLQDSGYTAAEARELIRGGAVGNDIAAMQARAEATAAGDRNFRNVITSNVFEADPYGGRYYTENPYDLSDDAVNVSTLADGTRVQWNAPINENALVTGFDAAGNFTVQNGVPTINAGEVNAAIRRAVSAGTLTESQATNIANRIANSVAGAATATDATAILNNYYDILNDYTTNVAIDPRYGIQTGQGPTRDIALENYNNLSNLIATNETMPSIVQLVSQVTNPNTRGTTGNTLVTTNSDGTYTDNTRGRVDDNTVTRDDLPSSWTNFVTVNDDGSVVPVEDGTYTGPDINSRFVRYDTRDTTANVVTPENYGSTTTGLGTLLQRPMYTDRTFNRTRPTVTVPQTFADRALLGERAPGGVDLASVARAAPATFGGVPTALPRPAANTSPEGGSAEEVIADIIANQGLPYALSQNNTTGAANAEAGATGMRKGGIASLARHGRHGDTMLAHITPEEARMLKAHGGSGTINPVTGLPEFFKIPGLYQLEKATRPITRPVRKLVEPALPFVKFIAPFIPGIGMPLAVGLGALASGMEGGHGFNLKKGIMGGITAYGMSNIAAGLGNAGATGATETATTGFGEAAATPSVDAGVQSIANASGNAVATTTPGASSSLVPTDVANLGGANVAPEPSMFSKMVNYKPEGGFSLSDYGRGIQNVSGLGVDQATTDAARTAFTDQAGRGTAMAVIGGATMDAGLAEQAKLKEQQQMIIDEKERKRREAAERAYAAMSATPWNFAEGGDISYDDSPGVDGLASGGSPMIAKYSGEDGSDVELPEYLRRTPDFEDTTGLSRLRTNLKAMPAGDRAVAGRAGLDYDIDKDTGISAGLAGMAMKTPKGITGRLTQADIGLRRKLGAGQMHAGITRDLMGGKNRFNAGYTMNFEAGGRFLSGGGDGMSDSIPSNIEGKQEARLSDGEFVIPADVVSHLGNGSSKAGAKRLYSMMDRVREARTGNPKQGKEINANKYLLA